MEKTNVPHVLLIPFPAQGHIKPMMKLADLLSQAGLQITFVNTEYYHNHLMNQNTTKSYQDRSPKFSFTSISDGLPLDHPRPLSDLLKSIWVAARPAFHQLLVSMTQRPTCIIADGIMSFAAIDAAQELGIPVITFRTFSASGLWAYFLIPKLIEQGSVPFLPDGDLNKSITCVPGSEVVLRGRDLPGYCRVEKADDPVLQFLVKETQTMTKARGLILNTFDDLEAPVVSELSSVFSNVYTIGPLHAQIKSKRQEGIRWKDDRSCMTWLDSQASRSVMYVSFGSWINLTRDQMLEFWYGLVNSEKPFLWVIRPDLIVGESGIDLIELEMVKERGCVVSWAPQEEVLGHPAVGGFLTHAGWNSTLESIVAGVPMICWPQLTEQFVNSRCVSDVWKLGFDMKDTCDRLIIVKLVRDLIDGKCEEIVKSSQNFARLAGDSVKPGGSSYSNLEKLVEDIKSMSS